MLTLRSDTPTSLIERAMQRADVEDVEAARWSGAMVALYDTLGAGDVARVDTWLRYGFANSRFYGGRTTLMLAATHSNAQVAVKMVDVALKHGAELHASDDGKRHVLMHACYHGAHASVIRRIMQHNDERGGWQLAWWHRDRDGLDAVALASKGGHGKLAAYLLDHMLDLAASPLENYPLKVLETALEVGNEACAMDVLASSTMQRAVRVKATQVMITRNPWQGNCTVYSCVDAAVKNNLTRAVNMMMTLNKEDVARSVWYSLHKLDTKSSLHGDGNTAEVSLEIRHIGRQYRRDRVWNSLRVPLLLRHRGLELQLRSDANTTTSCPTTEPSQTWRPLLALLSAPWSSLRDALGGTSDNSSGSTMAVQLTTLPDPLFRSVLRFLVPLAADELEEIRFWLDARHCRQCERLCIPDECRLGSSQ